MVAESIAVVDHLQPSVAGNVVEVDWRVRLEQLTVKFADKHKVIKLPQMVSKGIIGLNRRPRIFPRIQPYVSEVNVDEADVHYKRVDEELRLVDPLRVVDEHAPDFKCSKVASVDDAVNHPECEDLLVVNEEVRPNVELVEDEALVLDELNPVVVDDLLDQPHKIVHGAVARDEGVALDYASTARKPSNHVECVRNAEF